MWSADDLRQRLDVPLGDPPLSTRRTLHVERLVPRGASLEVDVVVSEPAAQVDRQRWRLSFDGLWEDVRQLPLDGARIVTRSGIEEWWDTRHSGEPEVGLTARRLDGPTG